MIGKHTIRTWSSTQPSVTLSSGEAEFYGLVKAAGAGLGHQSIMRDFGLATPVTVWTDSSAALGIATRSGLGKLRHLETHTLWVQEKVRTKAIKVRKVRGDVNPADIFTKHLPSKDKIHQLVNLFGCEYRAGRSAAAPLLRPAESSHGKDGHPVTGDALPTFLNENIEQHDINRLPHTYSDEDKERLFPRIEAPPEMENAADWISEMQKFDEEFREEIVDCARLASPTARRGVQQKRPRRIIETRPQGRASMRS